MKILIVEDDHFQAESLRQSLFERWPGATVDIVPTESGFGRHFKDLVAAPPDLAFIDVMLRWDDVREGAAVSPPAQALAGAHRAGIRCVTQLLTNAATANVPVILYTVPERLELAADVASFPPNVHFLQKTPDMLRVAQFAGSVVAMRRPVGPSQAGPRDVFICHAREDRVAVVDPLVNALQNAGITVWHDRAEIQWGDSLASKIQEGLARSRYVIAILSRHSLAKRWPLTELNAALSGEISDGIVKVLPLIVGSDADKSMILRQLVFQQDKLYETWTGSPEPIVRRLQMRLRFSS